MSITICIKYTYALELHTFDVMLLQRMQLKYQNIHNSVNPISKTKIYSYSHLSLDSSVKVYLRFIPRFL